MRSVQVNPPASSPEAREPALWMTAPRRAASTITGAPSCQRHTALNRWKIFAQNNEGHLAEEVVAASEEQRVERSRGRAPHQP